MTMLIQAAAFIAMASIYLTAWGQAMPNDTQISKKQSTHIEKHAFDLTNMLEKLNANHAIKKVTFIMDIPHAEHPYQVSESMLKEFGCAYITQDPTHISEILKLLKNSNMRSEASGARGFDIRKGIFFSQEDGLENKILLEESFSNKDVLRGMFNGIGMFNEIGIAANASLAEDLYRWAAKLGKHTHCDFYVDQYRYK